MAIGEGRNIMESGVFRTNLFMLTLVPNTPCKLSLSTLVLTVMIIGMITLSTLQGIPGLFLCADFDWYSQNLLTLCIGLFFRSDCCPIYTNIVQWCIWLIDRKTFSGEDRKKAYVTSRFQDSLVTSPETSTGEKLWQKFPACSNKKGWVRIKPNFDIQNIEILSCSWLVSVNRKLSVNFSFG